MKNKLYTAKGMPMLFTLYVHMAVVRQDATVSVLRGERAMRQVCILWIAKCA